MRAYAMAQHPNVRPAICMVSLEPLGQFQPNLAENMLGDGDSDLFK